MKKTFFIVVLVLAFGGFLSAQNTVQDFAFYWEKQASFTDQDSLNQLYPEINYKSNPSLLTSIRRPVVLTDLWLSNDKYTKTITQNEPVDGKSEKVNRDTRSTINLAGFLPLQRNMVAGFGFGTNLVRNKETTDWSDYDNNNDETISEVEEDRTLKSENKVTRLWPSASFAMQSGQISFGGRVGLFYENDPVEEEFRTDESSALDETIYSEGIDTKKDGKKTFTPWVNGGLWYSDGKLSAGSGLGFSFEKTTYNGLVAVDEDNDGNAEKLVSRKEYDNFSSLTQENTHSRLVLYPAAIYRINPTFSLVGSADVAVLDKEENVYKHKENTGDTFEYTGTWNGNFGEVTFTVGTEIRPVNTLAVRVGGGYGLDKRKLSVKRTSNNESTFSDGNSNNYPEVPLLGDDPANNEVINKGQAYEEKDSTFFALTGVEWRVSSTVELFAHTRFSRQSSTDTYYVYDTLADKVWKEQDVYGNSYWRLNSLAGVAVNLTDNILLTLSSDWNNYEGSSSDDEYPEDSSDKTDDLTDTSGGQLDINLELVIGL